MKRLSIRWRLTLWYGVVLVAILLGLGGLVYALMHHELLAMTDAALAEELGDLAGDVGRCRSTNDIPGELGLRYSTHLGYEFQVSTQRGEVLFRSDGLGKAGLPLPNGQARSSRPVKEIVALGRTGKGRLVSQVVPSPVGPLLIQSAVSLTPNNQALRKLLAILLSTGPLAVAGALGSGYFLARKALAPVDRMVTTANQITATRLDRRLEAPNPHDELGRLARTLNGMIERLQRSFEEVRRFTADAAHELRTPLAIMRTTAEVALQAPRAPEPDGQVIEDLLEEIERLSRLVEQLLFLCREDARITSRNAESVYLDELMREVTDHVQVVAREKALALELDSVEPCCVQGDRDRLRQLLFNLLDNAIKYTPAGGTVCVRCGISNERAKIEVSDTGIGISDEHLPRVFDRFYRVDPARSRETEGTGLGLSICRSIAESHGGQISLESTVNQGTKVTFLMPCARMENLCVAT